MKKITYYLLEFWPYVILFAVVLGVSYLLYDSIKTHSEYRALKKEINSFKDSVVSSRDRVRMQDSITAIELLRIREDLVELSKLREMNNLQIKKLQEELKVEEGKRESIGSTLINW